MEKKIFVVVNSDERVTEYFLKRDSAIAFIIDEFSMTLAFRDNEEGTRLSEYLKTHSETPNQYPFKYIIKEIVVNHDYDDYSNE